MSGNGALLRTVLLKSVKNAEPPRLLILLKFAKVKPIDRVAA
jgi:hypothetical protein